MNIKIIGENTYYTTQKLDVFVQLDLARKLSPATVIVGGLVNPENAGKDKTILIVMMLSNLSDEDSRFVVNKCLGTVFRQQGEGKGAPVMNANGVLMFDDIDMTSLLELTAFVLEENIGGFFHTALNGLKAPLATL